MAAASTADVARLEAKIDALIATLTELARLLSDIQAGVINAGAEG